MRCVVSFQRGKDWCELPSETSILTTFELCPGNGVAFLLRYSSLSRIGYYLMREAGWNHEINTRPFWDGCFLYAKKGVKKHG